MSKRIISISLSFVIMILFSVSAASADNTYNVSDLSQCGKLYPYSGNVSAYFYGFKNKTLYSSRVIPDCINRYVSVSGYIRAVSHDESSAYAIFDGGKNALGVVRMNMNNGSCTYCTISNVSDISNRSFAVCGNEIFIIHSSSKYNYVKSYDFNGQQMYTYSFSEGVECLFTNGGNAYAKANNGELIRLSGGNKTNCANLEAHTGFTDAGSGYILSDDNRLIPLNGGGTQRLNCDHAVRTSTNTFALSGTRLSFSGGEAQVSSAEMLCASGSKAAVLNNDYTCEVINSDNHITKRDNPGSGSEMKTDGSYAVGIEAEITVTQLKKKYPRIQKVLDSARDEVTSGNVRTGYFAVMNGGEYQIALRGDINSSGTMNTADTDELMTALAGASSLSPISQKAADYNFDGNVDTRDLVLIAMKVNHG